MVISLLAASVLGTVSEASAQRSEKGVLGLGLIIGEPTGVSAKLYLRDDTALDAAFGSAFIGGGWQIHIDYLYHPWVIEDRKMFVMPAYLGGGVRALRHNQGGDDDFHTGLRVLGGLLFDFKEIPLDVFVELALVVDYVLGTEEGNAHAGFGLDVNAGVGVRYYF